MSEVGRRQLIPLQFSDLSTWPDIETSTMDASARDKYHRRKRAVEQYAAGVSFADIRSETGVAPAEVFRLLKRCVTSDGTGGILGFTALYFGLAIKPYTRRAPVIRQIGDGPGGCAGALTQLFEAYPDVEDYVIGLFLKLSKELIHEARISYRNLQKEFLKKLKSLGFTDNDWPFNTKNLGYKSLRQYCFDLRKREGSRWVAVRLGHEASRRSNVGMPHRKLISPARPFSIVQLDYHKVDAASIIVLVNEHGDEIEVPVPRWYFGLLVEESKHLILGVYISLEIEPSADCCLETVYSGLFPAEFGPNDPEVRFLPDKKLLPGHLIPKLAGQCWSLMKVDNAWANLAGEALDSIISTVGCAINFGPVRAWWARPIVERIFKDLTHLGLQRLASTHGTGPSDTRVDDPLGKAIKFRILLSDLTAIICKCVRDFNEMPTEGLQYSSPLSATQAALDRSGSGLIPLKLPRPVQQQPMLLWHEEVCTVRGDVEKHVRPHISVGRCRYNNAELATSPWLIGKKVRVFLDRRDARNARAVELESGKPLGELLPEKKWANSAISWRDRKLLIRGGLFKRASQLPDDPVVETGRIKKQELMQSRKHRRSKMTASKVGLEIARIERNKSKANRAPSTGPSVSNGDDNEISITTTSQRGAAFQLDTIPTMRPGRRSTR
ncbi:MAG: hypothetical protein SF172_04245 [Burkholderiales bacterium]|nr:hypothetical protein [Burkholderiales bacterium]